MLRPALTAGLMTAVLAASLALAVPAAADGFPESGREGPAGIGRSRAGDDRAPTGYGPARRPVVTQVRRYHQPQAGFRRVSAIRPVSYGERDGPVFEAWLPRNTNLPIYNIPPSFFPEP
ncbi:hypothetical protein VQ03_09530 [Methylobacterium tarhaniae]|uniref:Uncharacterized protein n=1 Tax=Methylobacterium tarhaniae TaxID=1187852 RepID=A0A0J6T661_9HYPH|nr:hypothetical protein [Methylobacterium tarhaniae]KMO42920.1 hypothetical protein VQ03_09530 [Methylobacterium tarhaniae]